MSRPTSTRALGTSFYNRATEVVARELLGAVLEHRVGGVIVRGQIVETEAYLGEHDPACHAASGRTRRTEPLYGAPGTAYVYFVYGMHWCVNAVTRAPGLPSAVLIRAVEPLSGIAFMRERRPKARRDRDLCNGPAKLCQAFAIDGTQNETDLSRGPLRILAGLPIADSNVLCTPRIGISRAEDWLLRWVVAPPR